MKPSELNDSGFIDYSYQGLVTGENLYSQVRPPSPLNRWIQCFWQLNVPQGRHIYRSVPDNNVDCIFTINDVEDNFIVLPFYSPALFEIAGPVSYFGIRLRVLAQQWLTASPVGEWGNAGFEDVFGSRLFDGLCEGVQAGDNFNARCTRVSEVLLENLFYRGVDKRLVNFVQYAHQHVSSKIDISDKKCTEFSLSARHLRRLCKLYLGSSPMSFNKVLRFQKTLHLLNASKTASVWADCYYDQSHFIRDFKTLSGLTPREFTNMSVLYNATEASM